MSNPKFKHFVVVKFDYPETYKFLETKKQQLRWALLDSLRRQTNTNFVLVLNSSMPLTTEGFGEMIISPTWKDKVKKAAEGYEYVITTRLDADDFVTPDFIQTIQDNFEEKNKIVMVTGGWIYEYKTKRVVNNWMTKSYTTNTLSFIEKTEDFESVYVRAHGVMGNYFEVKRIPERVYIWVINEDSIRASQCGEGKYTGKFEDISDTLYKKDPLAKGIIERIDVWNNKISGEKNANK